MIHSYVVRISNALTTGYTIRLERRFYLLLTIDVDVVVNALALSFIWAPNEFQVLCYVTIRYWFPKHHILLSDPLETIYISCQRLFGNCLLYLMSGFRKMLSNNNRFAEKRTKKKRKEQ